MSVWRAEIDVSFYHEEDLISFLNLIETFESKLVYKKEGDLGIPKKVRYHKCKHDDGEACGNYKTFGFEDTEKFKKEDGSKSEPEGILTTEFKDKIKNKP